VPKNSVWERIWTLVIQRFWGLVDRCIEVLRVVVLMEKLSEIFLLVSSITGEV